MRFLFRYFTSSKVFNRELKRLEKKINDLEATIQDLKKPSENHFSPAAPKGEGNHSPPATTKAEENQPNIKIEHLRVEKIVINHMEYANNFGQLGIKDLSGKLNIGTSYEGDLSKQIEEKMEEKLKQVKVKMKAKKEEDHRDGSGGF